MLSRWTSFAGLALAAGLLAGPAQAGIELHDLTGTRPLPLSGPVAQPEGWDLGPADGLAVPLVGDLRLGGIAIPSGKSGGILFYSPPAPAPVTVLRSPDRDHTASLARRSLLRAHNFSQDLYREPDRNSIRYLYGTSASGWSSWW